MRVTNLTRIQKREGVDSATIVRLTKFHELNVRRSFSAASQLLTTSTDDSSRVPLRFCRAAGHPRARRHPTAQAHKREYALDWYVCCPLQYDHLLRL
jgi:hypothetical protein